MSPGGERAERYKKADGHVERVVEVRLGRNPKGVMVSVWIHQAKHDKPDHDHAQEKEGSGQDGTRKRSTRKQDSATPEYRR